MDRAYILLDTIKLGLNLIPQGIQTCRTKVRLYWCYQPTWDCSGNTLSFNLVYLHSKTPHVVTLLWQDSDDVVTILSPNRNLVEGYKTVYLCHLDSYTVTVCKGYAVTVQLPTRCLVDRFLHMPHVSGYHTGCVRCSHCWVVTVSGTREQWLHRHSGSHCVVTVPSRWLME